VCILFALEHLERQSIIHGDMKPENILIEENGYFLLGDFSSAHQFNCWNHEIRGTKGYIAPEIKQDERVKLRDNKSDLYSLGAILWEMAHGSKYSHYTKNHNTHYKDNELTGDSSDDSQDIPPIDEDFQEFVSCLLK
jgi:serine/threonine protein kinase